MQLESRVLSDKRILDLAREFVCVKVDPRNRGADREAYEYKSTRYVPELVLVGPDGDVLGRIEDRSPEGVMTAMRSALDDVKPTSR